VLSELCVALPDKLQVTWEKKCQKLIGDLKPGAVCTDAADCMSGRCQLVGSVRRCIAPCVIGGAAVCAAGTTCRAGRLEVRTGRTADLTFCQ
jgi:hypothetical protein